MKEYNKNKGIPPPTITPKKKSSNNNSSSTSKRLLSTSPPSGLATSTAADEESVEPKKKMAKKSNPADNHNNKNIEESGVNSLDDTKITTTIPADLLDMENNTSLLQSDVEASSSTAMFSDHHQQDDGTDLVSNDVEAISSGVTSGLVSSDVETNFLSTTTVPPTTADHVMSAEEKLDIASSAILSVETTAATVEIDSLTTLDDDMDSLVQPSLEEDMEMSEAIGSLNDW